MREELKRRIGSLRPEQREELLRRLVQTRPKVGASTTGAQSPCERGPLSVEQRQVWLACKLAPDDSHYNIGIGLDLLGPLKPARLHAALQTVMKRHGGLRTVFVEDEGEISQRVVDAPEVPLSCVDLSGLAPDQQERLLQDGATQLMRRSHALASAPPWRAALLRCAGERHRLVLGFHHLIADGRAMTLVVEQMLAVYANSDRNWPLRAPQYIDYARSQTEGSTTARDMAFWSAALRNRPEAIPLERSALAQSSRGAKRVLRLARDLTTDLRHLCVEEKLTRYTLVATAVAVMLYRVYGTSRVMLACPTSNRTSDGLDRVVGMFVNTLPLCVDLSGNPTVRELLTRVQTQVVNCLDHNIPLEHIVQHAPELAGAQDLFQIAVDYQRVHDLDILEGGLRGEVVAVDSGVSTFDMTFYLLETERELVATLEHDLAVVSPGQSEALLGAIRCVLEAMTAPCGLRIGELTLLSSEQERQLAALVGGTAPGSTRASVPAAVFEQAERTPDAIAVVDGRQHLTYAGLVAASARIATVLNNQGVGRSDVVAVSGYRSAMYVASVLAVMRVGATYLPLDSKSPAERLALMAQDAKARFLLDAGSGIDVPGLERVSVERIASCPGDELLTCDVQSGDPAYVMYTSGSTGRPKGVVVGHAEILCLCADQRYSTVKRATRVGQAANLAFDASTFELWAPLVHGGTVVMLADDSIIEPQALGKAIQQYAVEVLFLTTSLMHLVADLQPQALLGLDTLIVGGEACDGRRVRRVLSMPGGPARVVNGYGPTETVTFSAFHVVVAGNAPDGQVPIGLPLRGQRLYVLDACLRPLPPLISGELYVGGLIGQGYLHQPKATASVFLPDPFSPDAGARMYRTGDRVRVREDGLLEFLGRSDRQVKLRGFRVEPGEIEAVISQLPEVEQCAAALEPAGDGSRLIAYICGHIGAEDLSTLREEMHRRLPEVMVPGELRIVPRIPLTRNGKTDWAALRTLARPTVVDWGAVSPTLARVREVWQRLLERQDIDPQSSFFEVGGHSLLAVKLVGALRREGFRSMTVRDVFEHPSLQAQAALLDERQRGDQVGDHEPRAEERSERFEAGTSPLSLFQERLWLLVQLQPESSAYNSSALFTLPSPVDGLALHRALLDVVERHGALRTTMHWDGTHPFSRILHAGAVTSFRVVDLQELDESEWRSWIERLCRTEGALPIDLERGPLVRAVLFSFRSKPSVLLLLVHHIAFDMHSQGIIERDLGSAYEARRQGAAPDLPKLAVQYKDFACWQRKMAQTPEFRSDEAWWHRLLSDAPGPIVWPGAERRRHAAVEANAGAVYRLDWSGQIGARVQQLARTRRVSVLVPFAAALALLIQQVCERDDMLLGFDVSERPSAEFEDVVGFFINVLVMRLRLESSMDFAQIMDQVRSANHAAHLHGSVPFDRIVSGVSQSSAVQVLLSIRESAQTGDGSLVELLDVRETTTARWDLALVLHISATHVDGHWIYRRQAIDARVMSRLDSDYRDILIQLLGSSKMGVTASSEQVEGDGMKSRLEASLGAFLVRPKSGPSEPGARFVEVDDSVVLPAVVRPLAQGVRLADWARANREQVERALGVRGAVLFDGFEVQSLREFEAVASSLCTELYTDYGDLPPEPVDGKVYCVTPYPPEEEIVFHNEAVHTGRWPSRLFFWCQRAAKDGGQTPLADGRELFRRLDPTVRDRLLAKGVRYVRNFHTSESYLFGLDLSWQGFFHTEDQKEVMQRCQAAGFEYEWFGPDHLRVSKTAPVCGGHPVTKEPVFFQQILTHHVALLDPELCRSLRSLFAPEDLPRNVYYGDGTPLEEDVVAHIQDVHAACARVYPWREGNVIMVDNLLVSHARQRFGGERRVYVVLADVIGPELLNDVNVST